MNHTKKMVFTALFAALTCVATLSLRIPTPGTSGYIHPGDAVVILSGVFLNPAAAFLAAGIGSCLADLLGGYFIYVPITFVIKGLTACLCSLAFHMISRKSSHAFAGVLAGGVIDIFLVAGGYAICETLLFSGTAALASIPANLIQGTSGLVISAALYPLLKAVPEVRQVMTSRH